MPAPGAEAPTLKDYEHIIIWLDYFNKNLKKSRGRRQGLAKCVFDPTLKELAEAAASAGFEITEKNEGARFPRRPYVRSGYITLPKSAPKTRILARISKNLVSKRAKQRR